MANTSALLAGSAAIGVEEMGQEAPPVVGSFANGYTTQLTEAIRPIHNEDAIYTGFIYLFDRTLDVFKLTGEGGKVTNADGFDIRFETTTGAKLPHRLISYNGETGALKAYVRLAAWQVINPYYFNVYVGNAAVVATEEDALLLYEDYYGVWNPITGAAYKGMALTPTSVGSSTIFNLPAGDYATNSFLTTASPTVANLSEITVQFPIVGDAAMTTGGHGAIFWGSTFATDDLLPSFFVRKSNGYFGSPSPTSTWIWQLKVGSGNIRWEGPTNAYAPSTNQMLACTWGTDVLPEFYINGVKVPPKWTGTVNGTPTENATIAGTLSLSTGTLWVGTDNRGGNDGDWDGRIGEIRIKRSRLPSYVIDAEYDNLMDSDYFSAISEANEWDDENQSPACPPIIGLITDTATNLLILPKYYNPEVDDTIAVSAVSNPDSSGTATYDGLEITYDPNATGTHTFNFTITDDPEEGTPKSCTANVRVSVIAADTTPNQFTFTDVTGAELSTQYISNTVTISGITNPSPVTVSGGTISIDGGAFAATAALITNGQTLRARGTSSGSNSTAVNVVVNVGGVTDTYTITTKSAAGGGGSIVWKPGPKSTLNWSSVGYGNSENLLALRKNPSNNKTRLFDGFGTFDVPGTFSQNTGTAIVNKAKLFPYYTNTVSDWDRLKAGAPLWTIACRMFCSGGDFAGKTLSVWPTKGTLSPASFISPCIPVGYTTGTLTNAQKNAQMMDVWEKAAEGHFDHIWTARFTAIHNALVNEGMTHVKVILRPGWECNKMPVEDDPNAVPPKSKWQSYGRNHGLFGNTYACVRNADDVATVLAAFAKFIGLAKDVSSTRFYSHFNPHRESSVLTYAYDLRDFIPLNATPGTGSSLWDTCGPDYYDAGTTAKGLAYGKGTNEERWDLMWNWTNAAKLRGLKSWFDFCKLNGIPLSIGEWGLAMPGSELTTGGGDNTVYMQKMFDFFATCATNNIAGYEMYFNNSTSLLQPTGGKFPLGAAQYKANMGTLT